MITYELVKQLKDAGFMQKIGTHSFDSVRLILEGKELGEPCYIPTLSELIESCGEKFTSLWKMQEGWQAKYMKGIIDNSSNPVVIIRGNGSTPEEAVARLFLELNKK